MSSLTKAARYTYGMPPIVWTASPLIGIPETNPASMPDSLPREHQLFAAKGETVSFQIGIQAPADGNLTNVMVTAGDFTGGGNVIAKSNVVLYREAYTDAKDRPDPLIPFVHPDKPDVGVAQGAPFGVSVGSRQPVWVDVNVPRTARAGAYEATFTITSNQQPVNVTAKLKVWNFALPVKPSLKSLFLMRKDPTLFMAKELLRHRVMPKDEFALSRPTDIIAESLTDLTNLGLNCAAIPVWGNQPEDKSRMDPPKSAAEFSAIAARYGRELPLFCYSADEIVTAQWLFPTVRQWSQNLHAAGIGQVITVPPTPELYCDTPNCTGESRRSAVDVWVVLPLQYDAANVRHVLMKGDEVWSYNSEEEKPFRPRWRFDSNAIEFRIQPGFYNQSRGLTGLLYWAVDGWKNRCTVWNDARGDLARGDGLLVYPGDAIGLPRYVVPSIRLKWIRDGVNDFDYIELLKKTGRGEYAMSVVRQVDKNWETWTTPNELEEARRGLGEALDAT